MLDERISLQASRNKTTKNNKVKVCLLVWLVFWQGSGPSDFSFIWRSSSDVQGHTAGAADLSSTLSSSWGSVLAHGFPRFQSIFPYRVDSGPVVVGNIMVGAGVCARGCIPHGGQEIGGVKALPASRWEGGVREQRCQNRNKLQGSFPSELLPLVRPHLLKLPVPLQMVAPDTSFS